MDDKIVVRVLPYKTDNLEIYPLEVEVPVLGPEAWQLFGGYPNVLKYTIQAVLEGLLRQPRIPYNSDRGLGDSGTDNT